MPRQKFPIQLPEAESSFELASKVILARLKAFEDEASDSQPASEAENFIAAARRHPAQFREHLLRSRAGTIERIGATLDPWQQADFEAMDEAWLHAAGLTTKRPLKRRAYLERARGHSKTSDQALMACWILIAAPQMVLGVCCAASEGQAEEIILAAEILLQDNPWLAEILTIRKGEILNQQTGSACRVMPARANTTFGKRLDFALCDELTHWQFREVWTAIFSGIMKVPSAVLIVISNAGYGKGRTWQWQLREKFRVDPAWYFHALPAQQASWLSPEDIEEQRRILDPIEFKRLILNIWQSDIKGGIAYSDVQSRTRLAGPAFDATHGCDAVIGGLDVGIKHDRTSLVWLGVDTGRRKLKLLGHRTWKPSDFPDKKVDLITVEEAILNDSRRLGGADLLAADDWQAILALQRLSAYFPCEEVSFANSAIRREMAKTFEDAFQGRWFEIYFDEMLERDILAIEVAVNETSRTKVLTAHRDESGHADSGFALAIALLMGKRWLDEMDGSRWASDATELDEIVVA